MAEAQIVRWIGSRERSGEKPHVRKALIVLGGRKAWVVARGSDPDEARLKLSELIAAQTLEWEMANVEGTNRPNK